MWTREKMAEELKSLRQQEEQAIITIHQLRGAIQVCEHFLKEMDTPGEVNAEEKQE